MARSGAEFSIPAGIRVPGAPQLETHRSSHQPKRVTEGLRKITKITGGYAFQQVAVDHQGRGVLPSLVYVLDPDWTTLKHRRRMPRNRIRQNTIQLRGPQIRQGCVDSSLNGLDDITHATPM